MILPGAEIGDFSTVGAFSLVYKKIKIWFLFFKFFKWKRKKFKKKFKNFKKKFSKFKKKLKKK